MFLKLFVKDVDSLLHPQMFPIARSRKVDRWGHSCLDARVGQLVAPVTRASGRLLACAMFLLVLSPPAQPDVVMWTA